MDTTATIRLGPSRIQDYTLCGHRYYLEHVLKLPRNPKTRSLALIEGATMHSAIRAMVEAEHRGAPFSARDLAEHVDGLHARELADGFRVDDPLASLETVKERSTQRAKYMAEAAQGAMSQWMPVALEDCEREFEFSLPGESGEAGIQFVWRLDTYSREKGELWEWKGSTRASDLDDLPLQDALYARGLEVSGMPLRAIVHATVVCPENAGREARLHVQRFDPPTPAQYAKHFGRIGAVAKAIALGAFVPASPSGPSGWVCTPKYCMRWNECRFGTGSL